jgi:hypothetical protein
MRRSVVLDAILMTAAACGSTGTGTSPSPSPSSAVTTPASLTVELKITGLQAASIHVSHIHLGSCAARGAIKYALNPVIADDQGTADVKSTVKATYPPASGSWYVVVHVGPDMTGTNSKYLLCGNLFK